MAFNVDDFAGGRARSAVGDEGCVQSNTADTLNFAAPTILGTISGVVADVSVTVTKHVFFVPGVVVQLTHPSDTELSVMVEVADVVEVSPTESRLDIVKGQVFGAGFVGGGVSVAQNFLRPEVVYGTSADPLHFSALYFSVTPDGVLALQDVAVPGALWVESQWKGYKAALGGDFSGQPALTVYDNTQDTLVFNTGSAKSTTDDLVLAVAFDYTVDAPFASRVPVWRMTALSRGMTTTLEPTLDYERKGTPWYGHNPLVQDDAASALGGGWTPADVGIKVTTPGLVDFWAKAGALDVTGEVLTVLTPTPMVVNEHAGKFLNPNQNQVALFKILSNTATSIPVDAPMGGMFSVSELAYVIGPRVAVKYERALAQMKKFVNSDVRLHIIFE